MGLTICQQLSQDQSESRLGEGCTMGRVYVRREVCNKIRAEGVFCRGPRREISPLCPYMDNEGIIRLRTKIVERTDLGDFGIPAILPSSHPVVEMLVLRAHEESCHVGVQGLLSLLRERFWILKGRKTIRGILTKCVVCRRHGARHISTIPPALTRTARPGFCSV
jgi:hypothetical protein